MSTFRVTHLACDGVLPDGEPCDMMFRGADCTADVVRLEARAGHWLTGRPGGKDYCPECVDTGRAHSREGANR